MRHRSMLVPALLLPALLLGGCGGPAPSVAAPPARPSPPVPAVPSPAVMASDAAARGDRLYVRQDAASDTARVAVLSGVDGAGVRELPFGVPAPDWSVLYTAEAANGRTIVRALDMAAGRVLRETSMDGAYSLPATNLDGTLSGLSPNGKWLALVELSAQAPAYGQQRRSESRFVVLDTMFEQPARMLRLDGIFSFDAISNSGRALFLIEHLAPDRLDEYQVRVYQLDAAALDTRVIADKTQAPQLMAGTRLSSVASPDGSWLFSMYLNDHHGPFIHALNLNDAYALCLFLPAQAKEDWQQQLHWALAMSPNGRLYAVNGALGIVAEVDSAQPALRRSAILGEVAATAAPAGHTQHVAPLAGVTRSANGGAALSPDGKTLWASGANGLLAIAVPDLALRGRYLDDWAFNSLALSADGERVYAVDAERDTMLRIDAASGTIAEQLDHAYGVSQMLRIGTQP